MNKCTAFLVGFFYLVTSGFSYAVDYGSPVEDSSFSVFLLFDKDVMSSESSNQELVKFLTEDDAANLVKFNCLKSPDEKVWVAAALVPLITTMAGRIYEKYQDAKLDKLKKLKKESMNEYSKTLYLNSLELKKLKCAILVRYSDKKDSKEKDNQEIDKGLYSVITFDHKINSAKQTKGFTFTPKIFTAQNTTVKTLTDKKKPGSSKISAAIAVTLKAITQDENKLPAVSPLGAASVGLSKVLLNGSDKCLEDAACEESDLIPHIETDTVIALSIGVSEVGHVGIDFDKREAEINAIKEAYGPALKESIGTILKD